jgi:hypothetical protein
MNFFFGRIFPLIFLLAGAGILFAGMRQVIHASASDGWPVAAGEVRSSSVEYDTAADGAGTYRAEVLYAYSVDGVDQLANRVAFGDFGSSDPGRAQRIVNSYPAGAEVTVHYDPDDPARAVLEPGVHGSTWLLPGFGAIFFVAGAAMAVFLPRALRRQRGAAAGDVYDGPRHEYDEAG